jgi:hypothetical protein
MSPARQAARARLSKSLLPLMCRKDWGRYMRRARGVEYLVSTGRRVKVPAAVNYQQLLFLFLLFYTLLSLIFLVLYLLFLGASILF